MRQDDRLRFFLLCLAAFFLVGLLLTWLRG